MCFQWIFLGSLQVMLSPTPSLWNEHSGKQTVWSLSRIHRVARLPSTVLLEEHPTSQVGHGLSYHLVIYYGRCMLRGLLFPEWWCFLSTSLPLWKIIEEFWHLNKCRWEVGRKGVGKSSSGCWRPQWTLSYVSQGVFICVAVCGWNAFISYSIAVGIGNNSPAVCFCIWKIWWHREAATET